MRRPAGERGLVASSAPKAGSNALSDTSSTRRWMRSSRRPLENGGSVPSDDLASGKQLGRLAPLSTAGQPSSVSQMGFAIGTQAVGVESSMPPARSWCAFVHQPARSFWRNTQGLPNAPSAIGVRTCASRAASSA